MVVRLYGACLSNYVTAVIVFLLIVAEEQLSKPSPFSNYIVSFFNVLVVTLLYL